MANLTIRNLDESTKQALRVRAAQHGVSMEEEARRILRSALQGTSYPSRLGRHLLERFRGVADEAFKLPERQRPRTPPQPE
ncbi:FitA-like ribbon-helix-helix domain-containing protein [Meiothermus rufus]|uniref:FitA-like ribbon-helix-helix domain-containing protein n=1 Tax=Meiothermus rufus TaxID=604332 RepID=UPI0004027C1E|nr:plasmid stabilization protein [Meiothermus rufus]